MEMLSSKDAARRKHRDVRAIKEERVQNSGARQVSSNFTASGPTGVSLLVQPDSQHRKIVHSNKSVAADEFNIKA